ncbi:N-myristoyl transferase, putative [Ixodes scapularis]|uniref:Glycylpeptide N-tetradecanoyltransferase n=1 Tax=Ixodes scapularis TaxID=6945 RepID=B7PHL2_IXOSC|nr:N-myristoyl transferase, putative [Ixodes scapularis]|eukprot:XP_002403155.1 N-myristoyl transferase, putative [Ixodes scapularis]
MFVSVFVATGAPRALWKHRDEKLSTNDVNEPIESDKTADEIREQPYSLPGDFAWDTLDINDPAIGMPMSKLQDIKKAMEILNLNVMHDGPAKTPEEAMLKHYQFWNTQPLKELYQLLNENYVEDDDNMFRFDYAPEFLKWALQPPGWTKDWHCGVRVVKSHKLVGFISAVPATIRIYNHVQRMAEVNFLCVHKKLRSKRVAPVLIREITRRVNRQGIFQAVYTAGVVLPKPIGTCRYWHRSLNPRKLIDVRFSHLSRNMTMQRTLKLYKLPEYLTKFDLAPVFSEDEFRHWFLPRLDIVDSYVVEAEGEDGAKVLTDFVSFYSLPSTVMHHAVHKVLRAAYAFYSVATSVPLVELMRDALVVTKNNGYDVFNALDLMDNKEFLEKLKFGIGDGNLQYYLYNWRGLIDVE